MSIFQLKNFCYLKMNKIKYIFLIILFCGCSVDRSISPLNEKEQALLKEFQSFAPLNQVKIAEDKEPGEKLALCLTIVDKKTKQVVKNQRVHFYHTSTTGDYEPSDPNDETTARLNGTAVTDSNGRIYVETILPGDYGSSEDNRHIHTTVFGAKPEPYDIQFKQYSSYIGRISMSQNEQHFLADLKKTDDGSLVAFLTMEPKYP